MKNLFFLFFFCLSLTLVAQDAEEKAPDYVMFQTILLEPDLEDLPQLMANLAAHNKKYHTAGTPYASTVYRIATGPNVGKLVWMMGPCTWSDLDHRPSDEGHDEDWMNNVMTLLEGIEHGEYWKLDADLSKNPMAEQFKMYYIRYHEFSKTEGYRAQAALEKIAETMKAMDEVKHWSVYDNLLRQGYKTGRHLAMVSGMNSWSEMEDNWPFRSTFEEKYSKSEFDNFVREMEASSTNSWDEIWVYDAYLSGREE